MMENKLIIVEDKVEFAQGCIEHLGILGISAYTNHMTYTCDTKMIDEIIISSKAHRLFWLDINLGFDNPEGGLEIIKSIRRNSSTDFIVVYTAYPDYRRTCKELGADHFIEKGDYEEDLKEIRNLMIANLKNNGVEEYKYKSKIVDVDRANNMLLLECEIGEDTVFRYFPLDAVEKSVNESIRLEMPINIIAIKNKNNITHLFESI